jgi:hypothetical protein
MKKKQFMKTLLSLVATLFLFSFTKPVVTIRLDIKSKSPQVQYAVKKIQELTKTNAVVISDARPDFTIRTSMDSVKLKPEAYKIVKIAFICGGERL